VEDLLSQLWTRFKSHKAGIFILLILVLFGVLGFVALVSDIGFSDEVKTYRFWILSLAFGVACFYVAIWLFISIIRENKRLRHQLVELQQQIDRQNTDQENVVKLSEQKDEEITHLRQTILELIREITVGRIFEVTKVQYYKEKLYLTLKKRRGRELHIGDEIRVIDKAEGYIMGVFEVTEVRSTEYVARSAGYISPIWMGYVHETGNAEFSALPDSIAIYYPKDETL